jgi:O-antigen/teichoic acid export membrane protein
MEAVMPQEPSKIVGDMQRIAWGGSVVLLASIVGNGLNYLYAVFVARSLGPSTFGLYALGLTIFNVLIVLTPLGLETGVVRFMSRYLGLRDRAAARRTLIQATLVVVGSGLTVGFVLMMLSKPIAISLYHQSGLRQVLVFFGMAIPLAALATILLEGIRSFQTVRYTVLVKYVWEPCGKFLFSAWFLWAGYALVGVVGSLIVTLLISVMILMKGAKAVAGVGSRDVRSVTLDGSKAILAFCLPLTLSNSLGAIAPRSDVLILGYWVSSAEVGVYSAAGQTASVLALFLGSLNTLCAPMIGEIAATRDLTRLRQVYQAVARWTLVCTVPVFVLLVIFGQDILALFGSAFSGGAVCLIILAFGQVVYSISGLSGTILLMFGHSRMVMWNTLVLAVLLVGSNWWCIPRWGILGAGIAVAICMVAVTVISAFEVWSLYRVQPYTWSLSKPILAGILAGAFAWNTKSLIAPELYPAVGVFVLAVYIALLALFRFEDIDRGAFSTVLAKVKPMCSVFG